MKKSRKRKIIVISGVFIIVGLIVWFGIFRKAGKFDTLQAVPAVAPEFYLEVVEELSLFRGVSFKFAVRGFLGECLS